MSTPLTAGAAALIRQHLIQQRSHFQNGVKPSGALIKAFLVNGAESMAPGQFTAVAGIAIPAEDEIPAEPNDVNGFGRVNLTESLTPGVLSQTLFADEPDYAVETGQMRMFEVQVMDTAQPLKVTMVWTDAPGPVNVGGLQNELYLQVLRPDSVLVDGDTTPFPNVSNNVQQVVIDTPAAGTYVIRVRGVSVNQQAPGASAGPDPRQDFALAVSNGMGMSLRPVSIAQAIDTTGSMGSFGYITPAKERATQLVDFMRINDRVSITEFSQRPGVPDARTPHSLRLLGNFDPDWTDAHSAIDGLHSDGWTPIGAGLQEAWNQLMPEPSTRPRAIVLLSDGLNNRPPDPFTEVLPNIPADVPIFTVALGPAGSTATLQNIASSRPDGGYYEVASDEDVHKLHEIYAQVQALVAGETLIGLSSAEVESEGEASQEMSVEPDVEEATFTLSWDKSPESKGMELIVIGPDDDRYDAGTASAMERRSSGYHLVRVGAPKAGKWSLTVRNHGSRTPVRYTISGAVQSRLLLSTEVPRVGEKHLVLAAQLHNHGQPWDDAKVTARLIMPTRSKKQVLEEFGDSIRSIQLPDAVGEEGLSEEQVLDLKLAVFAQQFSSEEGGLYDRESFEVEMSPRGEGMWATEVPIPAPGNVTVEVFARGELRGMTFERFTTQSVHVPEPSVLVRRLYIEDSFVWYHRWWCCTIIGTRVFKADGTPAIPRDGVRVNMVLTQGTRSLASGDLPYYRCGRYYIWRFRKAGLKPGRATLKVQAMLNGAVVATTSRFVSL